MKDRLLSALIALMRHKNWSELTVTELISASGVARASFYRNFKTIEELVDYGLQQMTLNYHEESPSPVEDFHNRALMQYKFGSVPSRPPERCLQLGGDRKNEFAVDLIHPQRLVFKSAIEPLPRKENGEADLESITVITIMEVVTYHDQ